MNIGVFAVDYKTKIQASKGEYLIKINFNDKVVVVIGASSGIGIELSKAFHEEGAHVIATYYKHKIDIIRSDRWDAYCCDITNYNELIALRDTVLARFTRIDIAINCAGIIRDSRLSNMDSNLWSDVINVNLSGTMNFIKTFAEKMKIQNYGKIVLLSSVQGISGRISQANYSASKAGVFALSKVAAKEYAPYSIQINTVCPGYIETNMNKGQPTKKDEAHDHSYLSIKNNLSDLVNFILFICSDMIMSVTGQNFVIDSRLK